jgi:hypothetical protein
MNIGRIAPKEGFFQDEKPPIGAVPGVRLRPRQPWRQHAAAGTAQSARASLPSAQPRRDGGVKRLGGRVWRSSRLLRGCSP